MKTNENVWANAPEITQNLLHLLEKGNAHASLDKALENVPFKLLGEKPEKLPYSLWQLAEHIRIAQWDILEFSRNPKHVSPPWPGGYWPTETSPDSAASWKKCIKQIKDDRKAFMELIKNAGADLYTPFVHGEGQSLLKEALVLADHNSYHTGEIIVTRRLLDDWD
jgi:DinB superfamily